MTKLCPEVPESTIISCGPAIALNQPWLCNSGPGLKSHFHLHYCPSCTTLSMPTIGINLQYWSQRFKDKWAWKRTREGDELGLHVEHAWTSNFNDEYLLEVSRGDLCSICCTGWSELTNSRCMNPHCGDFTVEIQSPVAPHPFTSCAPGRLLAACSCGLGLHALIEIRRGWSKPR